jgi:hypothetical protein
VTNSTVPDPAAVDTASRTASIIPFPARPKPAELAPQERLVRALASLNAALADQRAAVTAWREVLGELKTSTNGLQNSLKDYRTNLQTLGNSVSALGAKARALEEWADGVSTTD